MKQAFEGFLMPFSIGHLFVFVLDSSKRESSGFTGGEQVEQVEPHAADDLELKTWQGS